jgi:cell division protein ZapA
MVRLNLGILYNGLGAKSLSQQNKQKLTVTIYGQQYTVVGDESTRHMRMVATMVDEKMREIGAKNPSLDTVRLAVLTAVNVVHDSLKVKEELETLQKKIDHN